MSKINKPFVRSVFDLGDFCDDEVNTEPSLTDPSQDEPIEALVARMLRGELVSDHVPQFDTDSDVEASKVFSSQSIITKDGFDLADAASIQARATVALSSLPTVEAPKAAPPVQPVVEASPLPDVK